MSFTAPRAWPRTSVAGSFLPTYEPITLGQGCTASVLAELDLVAVRGLSIQRLQTPGVGGLRPPTSSVTATRGWAIEVEDAHFIKAAGLVGAARHRYAGVRVYVTLYPTCPETASTDKALLRGVRQIVSTVRAHIKLLPAIR